MPDPMEALYQYAEAHMLDAYLCRDEHYAPSDLCARRQAELLRPLLTEQGKTHLKALLDELELVRAARDRAAFRAGFCLAVELGRM